MPAKSLQPKGTRQSAFLQPKNQALIPQGEKDKKSQKGLAMLDTIDKRERDW